MIYCDCNASTPLDPRVLDRLSKASVDFFANPSSVHAEGKKARAALDRARKVCASYFSVSPYALSFTSGGTEGINTLIQGFCRAASPRRILSSRLEHPSVIENLLLQEKQGVQIDWIPANAWGAPRIEDFASLLHRETDLIVLMAANNETAVQTDLEGIAKIAKEKGIPLIVDAVALLGRKAFDMPEGVSAFCVSGHKIYAPKGTGCIWMEDSFPFKPLFLGGGQERNKRSGTENLPSILAFAEAISILEASQEAIFDHQQQLRGLFEQEVLSKISNVFINGQGMRVYNGSNLFFKDVEGELLLMRLDLEGIAASYGSACSSHSLKFSHVLREMYGRERAQSSLRFSFGRHNTIEEIHRIVDCLSKLVDELRL